jgi:hypothetical protein
LTSKAARLRKVVLFPLEAVRRVPARSSGEGDKSMTDIAAVLKDVPAGVDQ